MVVFVCYKTHTIPQAFENILGNVVIKIRSYLFSKYILSRFINCENNLSGYVIYNMIVLHCNNSTSIKLFNWNIISKCWSLYSNPTLICLRSSTYKKYEYRATQSNLNSDREKYIRAATCLTISIIYKFIINEVVK